MPLENLFEDESRGSERDGAEHRLYQRYGILTNPFPSSAQTSGHPHLPTDADKHVDREIIAFIKDKKSHALAITASQGIGKTNLLNAYEKALREKLTGRGFFIIRYVSDPEPSFDPLIRSIFENLGEEHLKELVSALAGSSRSTSEQYLNQIRVPDIKKMILALRKARSVSPSHFDEMVQLAYQWLIGLPVRKAHREQLDVNFRLDTVESKTRALREIVLFSAKLDKLRGVFLLLDELEKQDLSFSKTLVLRYLSALRALIDALPKYLFMMTALTTDALNRYREMLPALKGRLSNEVRLDPITDEEQAIEYWKFYLEEARKAAQKDRVALSWREGHREIVTEAEVLEQFASLRKRSSIEGVRQRDFLNALNAIASRRME